MIVKHIEIKMLKDMGIHKAGDLIKAPAHEDGTPLDVFWRRRLKDAEQDGCCEIVKPAVKKTVSRVPAYVDEENE
jgi:hypothetical protein